MAKHGLYLADSFWNVRAAVSAVAGKNVMAGDWLELARFCSGGDRSYISEELAIRAVVSYLSAHGEWPLVKAKKKKRVTAKAESRRRRKDIAKAVGADVKRVEVEAKIFKPRTDKDRWLRLRYEVLKKYGAKCCLCNRSREDGYVMHVDHIRPVSLFPSLEFDINNLQVLCSECNEGKANTDCRDWRVVSITRKAG